MSSAQIQPIIIYRKIWNAQITSQYIAKPHVAPDCPTPFYGWSEEEKVTQSLQAETICATRPQKIWNTWLGHDSNAGEKSGQANIANDRNA